MIVDDEDNKFNDDDLDDDFEDNSLKSVWITEKKLNSNIVRINY